MISDLIQLNDIMLSTFRWAIGLFLGTILGSLLALMLAKLSLIVNFFNFLRAVPILGLVPVFQYYLGVNEYSKIGLISWAVCFPVAFTMYNSLQPLSEDLRTFLANVNHNGLLYWRYIILPRFELAFIRAVQVSIGIAWLVVVAAEMIGTYSSGFWSGGLGFKLFLAYEANRPEVMFLILSIFGILGIISSSGWEYFSRKIQKRKL